LPKNNPCATNDCGKLTFFSNTALLADYLKVDAETTRRWRISLVKSGKPLIWSYEGVLIDFKPEVITNKNKL
jgi:hypothetical protein